MIKIGRLSIGAGESLQLTFEGALEKAIVVGIDKQGNAFISGPMNANMKTLIVTEEGLMNQTPAAADDRPTFLKKIMD